MTKKRTAINPTREENYASWYQEVIKAAELAETSEVRGCMVIKPWGYGLWEGIRDYLDIEFRRTGHKNAYFPLFIPLSYLQKEADHISGFAKECAVVTHHRLEADSQGKLLPAGELEEPLIVRPTSETVIGETFAKWVNSYRDLPILINQWANVVRWEMRTRLFLRTAEFLWQEGHTVHASKSEAESETRMILDLYKKFAEEVLAIPVIAGEKTASERFPGAENTYSIEAMMQDRKALQAGTSHFLGQKFSKSSNIKFQNKSGQEEYAWTTSWGVSTRLIGALIMTHADDNGMIVPPRIAPSQIAILPVYKTDEDKKQILAFVHNLKDKLESIQVFGKPLRIEIDDRDIKGGNKNWQWIKRGVPIKIEIGMRDLSKQSLCIVRRDDLDLKKEFVNIDDFLEMVAGMMSSIQDNLFERAKKRLEENTIELADMKDLLRLFNKSDKKSAIQGGFVKTHWCGDSKCENELKEHKLTIRNIPLGWENDNSGKCIVCQKQSQSKIIIAKEY